MAASPLRGPFLTATIGILSLVTLVAFEATAVTTAMPVMAADLDAIRSYGFAFSAFLTASMFGVVIAGSWNDSRGPAWPTRVGLGLFAVGLVVSGTAVTMATMLVGRAMAGAGAGLLIVSMYVVIAQAYPSALQPRVFALLSAAWVVPGLVGPGIAGLLAERVSWRAVFLLVPPLALLAGLALLPAVGRLSASAAGSAVPLRRVATGAGLAAGMTALLWGLGAVQRPGVGAGVALSVAGGGLLSVLTLLPPLLPPGALRLARGLPTVLVLRGLFAAAFFGVEAFVPLMLITGHGMSPTVAGLTLSGATVGWTIGSFVQGRPGITISRHHFLVACGAVLGFAEIAMVAVVIGLVPAGTAAAFWGVAAFGMGLGMSSTSVLTLRLSEPGEEGRNSAGLQLCDVLGGALGIGVAGAVFAARHDPVAGDAGLFAGIWLAGGLLALLSGLLAVRARTPRAG